MRALGMICGTSLDGIDVALVDIVPRVTSYAAQLVRFETVRFEAALAAALRAALPPHQPSPATVAALDGDLGAAFAAAGARVRGAERVDFIASHGVTLYHGSQTSVQVGDPFVMRETLQATVVADFRRADCAAGGEGAPLVPYVDALLFASDEVPRAALNLGGIANVTLISQGGRKILAWDVGPANILLDAFMRARTGGAEERDDGGQRAARGHVSEPALRAMLADPYFALPPPKSTGRERFGEHFLAAHAALLEPLALDDGCATLTALTASAVGLDLEDRLEDGCAVIVSGGGAHNRALMDALERALPRARVVRSDTLGIDVDAKEALAFAVLGYETLRGRPAGIASATGARHAALLGAVVPHELRELLARIDREVAKADGAPKERTLAP